MSNEILHHVESLSRHRDTALLDRGVIGSLQELLGLERGKLVEINRRESELFCSLSAWSDSGKTYGSSDMPLDNATRPLAVYAGAREAVERHENVDATANGRHIVWIPVHADNTPVACFELERSYPLTEQQVDVAKGIIALYRNFRALLEYSQQDTLTGLANRKTFDRSLAAFINSAQSAGKTSIERRASNSCDHWLAVIDIDHFKSVNDRFGHLYGDEVLILVANRMRDTFRVNPLNAGLPLPPQGAGARQRPRGLGPASPFSRRLTARPAPHRLPSRSRAARPWQRRPQVAEWCAPWSPSPGPGCRRSRRPGGMTQRP